MAPEIKKRIEMDHFEKTDGKFEGFTTNNVRSFTFRWTTKLYLPNDLRDVSVRPSKQGLLSMEPHMAINTQMLRSQCHTSNI